MAIIAKEINSLKEAQYKQRTAVSAKLEAVYASTVFKLFQQGYLNEAQFDLFNQHFTSIMAESIAKIEPESTEITSVSSAPSVNKPVDKKLGKKRKTIEETQITVKPDAVYQLAFSLATQLNNLLLKLIPKDAGLYKPTLASSATSVQSRPEEYLQWRRSVLTDIAKLFNVRQVLTLDDNDIWLIDDYIKPFSDRTLVTKEQQHFILNQAIALGDQTKFLSFLDKLYCLQAAETLKMTAVEFFEVKKLHDLYHNTKIQSVFVTGGTSENRMTFYNEKLCDFFDNIFATKVKHKRYLDHSEMLTRDQVIEQELRRKQFFVQRWIDKKIKAQIEADNAPSNIMGSQEAERKSDAEVTETFEDLIKKTPDNLSWRFLGIPRPASDDGSELLFWFYENPGSLTQTEVEQPFQEQVSAFLHYLLDYPTVANAQEYRNQRYRPGFDQIICVKSACQNHCKQKVLQLAKLDPIQYLSFLFEKSCGDNNPWEISDLDLLEIASEVMRRFRQYPKLIPKVEFESLFEFMLEISQFPSYASYRFLITTFSKIVSCFPTIKIEDSLWVRKWGQWFANLHELSRFPALLQEFYLQDNGAASFWLQISFKFTALENKEIAENKTTIVTRAQAEADKLKSSFIKMFKWLLEQQPSTMIKISKIIHARAVVFLNCPSAKSLEIQPFNLMLLTAVSIFWRKNISLPLYVKAKSYPIMLDKGTFSIKLSAVDQEIQKSIRGGSVEYALEKLNMSASAFSQGVVFSDKFLENDENLKLEERCKDFNQVFQGEFAHRFAKLLAEKMNSLFSELVDRSKVDAEISYASRPDSNFIYLQIRFISPQDNVSSNPGRGARQLFLNAFFQAFLEKDIHFLFKFYDSNKAPLEKLLIKSFNKCETIVVDICSDGENQQTIKGLNIFSIARPEEFLEQFITCVKKHFDNSKKARGNLKKLFGIIKNRMIGGPIYASAMPVGSQPDIYAGAAERKTEREGKEHKKREEQQVMNTGNGIIAFSNVGARVISNAPSNLASNVNISATSISSSSANLPSAVPDANNNDGDRHRRERSPQRVTHEDPNRRERSRHRFTQ